MQDQQESSPEDPSEVVPCEGEASTADIATQETAREVFDGEAVEVESPVAVDPSHPQQETSLPPNAPSSEAEEGGGGLSEPVMKRAVSTPIRESTRVVLPPLKVTPVGEMKRAVSTPTRTPTDEEAALAAIKTIDALPKLPSRQRTDTHDAQKLSSRLSPLRENSPSRHDSTLRKLTASHEPICSLAPLPPEARKMLPQLPPLQVKSIPQTDSCLAQVPEAHEAVCQLPPPSEEERMALPQLPPLQAKNLPKLESSLKRALLATQDNATEANTNYPELPPLQTNPDQVSVRAPETEEIPQLPQLNRETSRELPWLVVKSQPDPKAMRDRSAPAACSSMRRPRSSEEDASGIWCAPDDRSEAPVPPRRQLSGDNGEDMSCHRKTKARQVVASDPLAQARERFQKEPATPATLASKSRRARVPKGPSSVDKRQQRGSVRHLQEALSDDLDDTNMESIQPPPQSPRRRSTGDRVFPHPTAKDPSATDMLELSNSAMQNSIEIRKNAFVRRGWGSRANLSLSPSRQTHGSSNERRARRKVASCDGGGDRFLYKRTSTSTSRQQHGDDHRHHESGGSRRTRVSTRVANHSTTRSRHQPEHDDRDSSSRRSRHSQEEPVLGKSSWSPTSSISLESGSFEWNDLMGEPDQLQESEFHDDECCHDKGCKRPPVEYIKFRRDPATEPIHTHPAAGHSGQYLGNNNLAQRPGLAPALLEAGSGTRTTMEAEASLTWAYDLSTGTYKLVPMVINGGMPWLCICGQENEADFSFCGMCAQPQRWTCQHCQFNKNKCRFPHCGGCGARRAGDLESQPPRPTFLAVDPIY